MSAVWQWDWQGMVGINPELCANYPAAAELFAFFAALGAFALQTLRSVAAQTSFMAPPA